MNITNLTNPDLDLGIVEDPQTESLPQTSFTLLGDYYLILLDKYVQSSDLIHLKYNKFTSDSGREAAELDAMSYLPKGTIVQIGLQATNPYNLSIGDRVFISPQAMTPHYQFFPNRDKSVIDFTGLIKVTLPHIEALIN